MLLRWLNFIEQFDLSDVRYRKGKENPADLMSRPPDGFKEGDRYPGIAVTDFDNLPDDESPDLSTTKDLLAFFMTALNDDEFFTAIENDYLSEFLTDDAFARLRTVSAADPLFKKVDSEPSAFKGKFKTEGELLWWIKGGHDCLFIPSQLGSMRKAIFHQHHDHLTGGHFGAQRTVAKMRQNYWWDGMNRDVVKWVSECITCLATKARTKPPPRMQAHNVPERPWEVVFMDETSGFPMSCGCDAIWVVMDKLSKMVHFIPIRKLGFDSPALAKMYFSHVFKHHGLPRVIVSDRDARINDDFWLSLFRAANVHLNISTPYHPQTDSTGEAAVKICVNLCRRFVNSNRDDWFDLLPALEFAYNSTPGTSGHSPFEINGLQQPRSAQTRLIDATLQRAPVSGRGHLGAATLRKYGQVIKDARQALTKLATEIELPEKTVVHKFSDEIFKEGDRVLLHHSQAGASFPHDKFADRYVGPFRIKAVISPTNYELELPSSMHVSPVQHVSNLVLPSRNASFPPPEIIGERGPDEPEARLTENPIAISKLYFETLGDGTIEVFADTPHGRYSLHELCVHQHFDECSQALKQFDGIRSWPYHLGRHIEQRYWRHGGFISGYDPNDVSKAFQFEFPDSGDSYWGPRSDVTIKRLTQVPERALDEMVAIFRRPPPRPLRVLELCCGAKSFARQLKRTFPTAEAVTVDISSAYQPDIVVDIRHWDFLRDYSVGYFDIIWASPPCTEYSPAKAGAVSNPRQADRIVKAALAIIKLAQPRVWFLENPHTMLFKRPFMHDLEHLRHRTTYCRYGFLYKKPTDIWSNIGLKLHHCDDAPCRSRIAIGRHEFTAQQGVSGIHQTRGVPRAQANFVPVRLLRVLIRAASDYIKALHDERITWK